MVLAILKSLSHFMLAYNRTLPVPLTIVPRR